MIGPLAYIGGKRRLAGLIAALLHPHLTYVEPFAGGAQVLFQKEPSKVEVLNDIDGDVHNFFVVLQRHPTELARVLRLQPASRRLFDWHRAPAPVGATDIERAARFYYLQRNAWGGKRTGQSFRIGVTARPTSRTSALSERLERTAGRLERVVLESLPYEEVIRRYDRPTTLFYCDPPYVDVRLYAHNFSDSQFEQLAELLGRVKGKFLLSLNDTSKTRRWFRRFEWLPVDLTYTARRVPRKFPELLIANYTLPRGAPT